ncbi:MAG: peptidase M15 [Actinomycetota bacterium]|nr:peptidase M15 [Actinomycetota bacterium]
MAGGLLAAGLSASALLADVHGPQADLRYATPANFTGAPLPGYACRTRILLRPRAARALGAVERDLRRRRLGLRVLDAYRPARASRAMAAWARRTGNAHLLRGYIAERSNHNRGLAVDVTLVDRRTGRALPMGTRYDAFTPAAHTAGAAGRVARNRGVLVAAMARRGFVNYRREWWHFDFPTGVALRRLDVPLRC